MTKDKRPIGVFDSGVGGLTVAKELMTLLPDEKILYFGDTARVPYGIKSKETVTKFSLECILYLLKKDVKLIVVACNTVSSVALPSIQDHFRVPIIGVIRPGAQQAIAVTKNKKIGVIATRSTINSSSYVKTLRSFDPAIQVFTKSCPMFVPLAEEGWERDAVAERIAHVYLDSLRKRGIDTLILGCTHYPILKNVIAKVMGKKVYLVDSAKQVALEVKHVLERYDMLSCTKKPKHEFYVTDESELFHNIAERFLGHTVTNIRKVNVV